MSYYSSFIIFSLVCITLLAGCTSDEASQQAAHDDPLEQRSQATPDRNTTVSARPSTPDNNDAATAKGAPNTQNAPPPNVSTPPSTSDTTRAAGDDSAPNEITPTHDSDEAREEERARQFQFDGSDEELEMILGQRDIPPFYIDDLLTISDLRSSLGPHTPTQVGHLEGQRVTPYYNHRWFRSAKDDRMGVVFQYWHFQTPTAAATHYELMETSAAHTPNAVGVASQAFYTSHEDTTALVALSLDLPAVIAVTCDVEMCHVPQLMRWAKLVESRARN